MSLVTSRRRAPARLAKSVAHRTAVVLAAAAIASACSSSSTTKTATSVTSATTVAAVTTAAVATTSTAVAPTTAAPTTTPPTTVAVAKELRVGMPGDTTNVDGDKATLGQQSPNANIYERLIRMDDNYQLQPWLAEKWEFVEPNTWRFHLRKDVTFSDGSPLTAKDVVWTFDRAARAGGRNINAAEGATKAVDDYTVDFTPSKPNRKVPLQIVHPTFGIMKTGSDPVKAPIGSGPFAFVSYTAKESFKVIRNEKYWDKAHAAKVGAITFRYLPDASTRMLALKAGDVDAVMEVPRESVAQAKSDGQVIELSAVGAYEAMYIALHNAAGTPDPVTADVAVRKAIAMAIDRKAIVDKVWEGNADYGKSLVPPAIMGSAAASVKGGPEFNLDGAKAALDAAGWKAGADGIRAKDGVKLELTLISGFPSPDVHRPIPEVIQQQLAKAGVAVKITETTDYSNVLKAVGGQLWLERGNQNDANPAFLPAFLFTSPAAGNKVDYALPFGIGDALDKPMAAAATTEDIAKTQALTADAMKAMIDDQVVIVPIAGIYNIWAHSKKVTGFKPHSAFVHTDLSGVSFVG